VIGALDRKLLRDLWHARGQVLATAVLVACGIAVFVMSQGMLLSLSETRAAYYERYRFAHIFATVKRAPQQMQARIAAIPGVQRAETRIVDYATLDLPGLDEPATGQLVSVPAHGQPVLNGLALRQGRWLRPGHPDEVIIGEAFAEANGFGPGSQFDAVINGHKRRLQVVAVALSPEFVHTLGPGFLVPDDRRFGVLWMSHEALEAALDLDGAFNAVSLSLRRDAQPRAVIEELDRLLAPYGGIGAHDREDQSSHAFLKGELDQLRATGRIIPPIFLAVAAFMLNVIVARLIETEREQIGLLKAFGYTDLTVGWHYLKFVLLMVALGVLLGSVTGIAFGRWVTGIFTEFYRFPFLYYRLEPGVFVAAAAIGLVAAVAGALGAVRRAVRLAPATAMQPAPPVLYRRGLIDRLAPMARLDEATRMIVRHLLRWPLRAGLTMLGLAMSVALMVSTLFFFDSVEHLVETFFHHSHRPDVTVTFAEPEHPRVLQAIARLPGVLQAEPARAVAVRLRHGHLSERTALQGVRRDGELIRVLDADLNPVVPPEIGLMLSMKLAKLLDAGHGDRIMVEVLEGRRPVLELPVTALIQEYLGTPAYIEQDALQRLMAEGPRLSAVELLVDPHQAEALYRRLKETPQVASVTLWRVALQSFRDTMAETINIIISFYVAFGCAIAFGVAYNSVRIALSERGRELASLRVLGFTRFEVSYILLGELALLLLPALPLGCLIGYALAAVMVQNFESDLFRIPLMIEPSTYGLSALMAIVATVLSSLLVRRRLDRLDLVAVLKTRE